MANNRKTDRIDEQQIAQRAYALFEQRGAAHGQDADDWHRAEHELRSDSGRQEVGISNRESPAQEAEERREHPPLDPSSPPPEDAAGRVGDEPIADMNGGQTSHKAGSRSVAQKEAGSRYPDRSMPPTRKVAGAFGKESDTPPERGR
jgi:hypothetical protein